MKRILFAAMLLVIASSATSVIAQTKKPITKDGLIRAAQTLFDALKANDLDKVKSY